MSNNLKTQENYEGNQRTEEVLTGTRLERGGLKKNALDVYSHMQYFNLFPIIESSGILAGVVFDEIKCSKLENGNIEILYDSEGTTQAAILIDFTDNFTWTMKLGSREYINETGDTFINEDGSIFIEE